MRRSRKAVASTHHGNDVRHTVARVDDRAGERAVGHLVAAPAGRKREHGLHGNVQALDVERLEHDLGGRLAVLRRVERRLGLQASASAAGASSEHGHVRCGAGSQRRPGSRTQRSHPTLEAQAPLTSMQ
jgi:hypothetical protein